MLTQPSLPRSWRLAADGKYTQLSFPMCNLSRTPLLKDGEGRLKGAVGEEDYHPPSDLVLDDVDKGADARAKARVAKLKAADLPGTSTKMKEYNAETKDKLFNTWSAIFHKMFDGIEPAAREPRPQIMNFDASMKAMYGVKVHGSCVGDTHHI